MRIHIGTYSKGGSKGIYVYDLDTATGRLSDTGHTGEAQNPSFVALHPGGRFLYAVSEAGQGSGVSAFALHPQTGALTLLNQQPSGGAGPCHVAAHSSGRLLTVAHYGGGNVASLPISNDGRVGEPSAFFQHEGSGPNKARQSEPHAHSVTFDPAGRFAFACDLGLDKIITYPVDAEMKRLLPQVLEARTHAGAGPRHFAFHPTGRFGYSINELDSTITAFAYDAARGELKEIHSLSTLPEGFTGQNSTADIHVSPSGRFLYGSNRGHDSIAIYSIDGATGRLTLIGHEPTGGKTPRNFGIDPTGAFLLAANQNSNNIVAFRIDAATGLLSATGQMAEVPSPVCVRFSAR